jgi:hypothetical protein
MTTITKMIRYDLTAADHLTGPMTAGARATDRAASAMDAASRSARVLDRALGQQRKATDVAAGASLALARADKILEEAEHGLADGALEAEFALKKQAEAAKKAAVESAAAGAAAKGAGGGFSALSSPMGAAVVAGVALSPVLVTLATGLGGFGLAAMAVAKNQKLMAAELAPLKSEYAAFTKSLQPEVLAVFNKGVGLAGHLLHDVQPVAQATGKALGGVLAQIDAEFQSGSWQDFFGFMARTAGPDLQLVGNLFVDLAKEIPPLLTQLQPLAEGFLKDADGALKLVNAGTQLVAWEHQHAVAVSRNTGLLGEFGHAAQRAFEQMFPGVKVLGAIQKAADHASGSTSATSRQFQGLGDTAGGAAQKVLSLEQQVNGLTNAENKALTPLLTYTNAVLAQRNDAGSLATALKKSYDQVGLNTAAQRASFSAANTYIQDLVNTASAAQKSHQGIDAQITSIRNALPLLQHVKGGTAQYWQEVRTLVGWLQRLQQMKLIQEKVHITGDGQWAFVQGGGQNARLHAARGAYVTAGSGPTADDVLARVSRGELIVPARYVSAGLTDHLRGMIPGFAQGGIVPSYAGSVGGLQPWGAANWQATVTQISTGIAKAMAAQVKAAAAGAAGAGVAGPGGGAPAANAALARKMMPAWGSGPQWAAWNYVAMRESGWNQFARNPSSGAYGIPQALPPGKMGAAANPPRSNPAAQISWMIGYIRGRYGDPAGAAAHERAFNWYDQGGLLMPGLTLAMNGTGQPEHVMTGEGVAGMLDQLTQILGAIQQLTTVVSSATGGGVSGPPGGIPVAGYPGIVVPTGGGFGLTRGDLGLPPPSSGSGGTDTGGGDTSGSGTTTPSPGHVVPKGRHRPAPNLSRTAAIKVLTSLLARDVTHNRLAAAQQANALLDWLGVHTHDKALREIAQLDHLLLGYRKAKNPRAVAATEQLLRSFGVRDFTPEMTVKGNPAKKALTARLEQVMKTYIAENDLRGARQDNALLTHLGVGKYTGVIGQITMFDRLLAQYKKKKDSKDLKAVEQVLRTMGVRKFARGGWITEPVTGIGASGQMYQFAEAGRPELVIPAAGASAGGHGDMAAELRALRRELRGLTDVARAIPAATGRHVAAGVNGGTADAVFRGRYPG